MRFVTVGRHPFTERQRELLRRAGLDEEVARVQHVESVEKVVELAKSLGAAIVVQALPLPMMVELVEEARRSGVPVYAFRIENVALLPAETYEEARKLAEERDADLFVYDPDTKTVRLRRTTALQRVRRFRVILEAEDIARVR